jgi:tryptophan halogenase
MNIIILGGGTAGLVTALITKKTFPKYNVTVIKSDAIGIIGVGEGSTHHWRDFTDYCNISTKELLVETEGTLKRSIELQNWNGDNTSYFHTGNDFFYSEYKEYSNLAEDLSFLKTLISNDIKLEDPIVYTDLVINIKQVNQYHFNTNKLNDYLQKVCKRNNINLIDTTIKDILLKSNNDIDYLVSTDNTKYSADFFIDSSGFKRFIISKLGAKWVSYKKYLPMNHAIAFPSDDIADLRTTTLSRALSSGWNWKIPTKTRYGNGYVFCDEFIDSTKAYDEVQRFYSNKIEVAKDIKFDTGRIDNAWINNCIAVGLSGSFVEPLEASSIGNTIVQAFAFVKMLPAWKADRKISQTYNKQFSEIYDNIVNFIQLHYFTKRSDSKFWKELPNIMTKTDFNQEYIDVWRKTLPQRSCFNNQHSLMFPAEEFTSIMSGLKLFDTEYIKQQLIETYIPNKIQNNLKIYDDFLKQSKKQKYIKHEILLQQLSRSQ